MSSVKETNYSSWPADRLLTELRRLKENLQDLEETHAFTFGKTTVHIGAERARTMQEEFEAECSRYRGSMACIERILKTKEG